MGNAVTGQPSGQKTEAEKALEELEKQQRAKQMLQAVAQNYMDTSPGVGAPQQMLGLMQTPGFTPMQGGGSQAQIDSGLLEALMAQMQNRM